MLSITNGITFWLVHFWLIAALTLTVWIPCNSLFALIDYTIEDGYNSVLLAIIAVVVYELLEPIAVGAVLFAVMRKTDGKQASYGEALQFGLRSWGRLFSTQIIANLITMLGLLCFLVPGIVIMVRFALIDSVVVAEQVSGRAARERSSDLALSVWGRIVTVGLTSIVFAVSLLGAFYAGLDFLYETAVLSIEGYYVVDVAIGCLVNVLSSLSIVIFFFLYREATGNPISDPVPLPHRDDFGPQTTDYQPDDGNPFSPPTEI